MRTLDRWDFYVTRFLSDWTLSFFCTTFVYLLFLLRFCQCTFFCLTCFWIAILTYSLCVILWSKQAFISMHEFFVCFFLFPPHFIKVLLLKTMLHIQLEKLWTLVFSAWWRLLSHLHLMWKSSDGSLNIWFVFALLEF